MHEHRQFLAACQGIKYEVPDFDNLNERKSDFEWQKLEQEKDKASGRHPFRGNRIFSEKDLQERLSTGKVIGINAKLKENLKKVKVRDVFNESPRNLSKVR